MWPFSLFCTESMHIRSPTKTTLILIFTWISDFYFSRPSIYFFLRFMLVKYVRFMWQHESQILCRQNCSGKFITTKKLTSKSSNNVLLNLFCVLRLLKNFLQKVVEETWDTCRPRIWKCEIHVTSFVRLMLKKNWD